MITWVVASHDEAVLRSVLYPGLTPLPGCDEVVVVRDAPSIAAAYNQGQARATKPVRVYLHHDVRVLDLFTLRRQVASACSDETVGLAGVVGSLTAVVPWWQGRPCGSVQDTRITDLRAGPGGHGCAYLDGLLLATSRTVEWDETIPGWHLYDADMCQQQLAAGLRNWCMEGGASLVRHETGGTLDAGRIPGWPAARAAFAAKWAAASMPATGR